MRQDLHSQHSNYETIEVDDKIFPQFSEWKGLKSIGRVSTVAWKQDKETIETRFYLLSYKGAEKYAKSAKGHWAVEFMRWILDVTFGEEASRKRKDHAP